MKLPELHNTFVKAVKRRDPIVITYFPHHQRIVNAMLALLEKKQYTIQKQGWCKVRATPSHEH